MSDTPNAGPAAQSRRTPSPKPDTSADDLRKARALASIGATVTLAPDSDAALGARGGLADDMAANIEGRNAALPPEVHTGSHGGVVTGAGADAVLERPHGDSRKIPAPPAETA
jgi:hypothetical protein